jgi:hypothetical protein
MTAANPFPVESRAATAAETIAGANTLRQGMYICLHCSLKAKNRLYIAICERQQQFRSMCTVSSRFLTKLGNNFHNSFRPVYTCHILVNLSRESRSVYPFLNIVNRHSYGREVERLISLELGTGQDGTYAESLPD